MKNSTERDTSRIYLENWSYKISEKKKLLSILMDSSTRKCRKFSLASLLRAKKEDDALTLPVAAKRRTRRRIQYLTRWVRPDIRNQQNFVVVKSWNEMRPAASIKRVPRKLLVVHVLKYHKSSPSSNDLSMS